MNVDKRKKRYERHIKHMSSQPRIYNSVQKYGWENHTFDIIEECSVEQLSKRETYWKQFYLDKNDGNWDMVLFCDLYDVGGGPLSESTRKKISKALLGKKHMLGKKHSEETKKMMSEVAKGKPKSESHKNNMRKPRSEQAKINMSLGKKGKPSPMKGKSRTYKGRTSPNKGNTYSEEAKTNLRERLKGNLYSAKPIKNTSTGMVWESQASCALFYNVSGTTISNWIKLNKHNLIQIDN